MQSQESKPAIQRVTLAPAPRQADSNIRPRYAIEHAAWVWHPETVVDEHTALRFVNHFSVTEPVTIRLHLSADQRFEAFLDGDFFAMGPDRSDVGHWSFASYDITLPAGEHTLEAHVWWIGALAPLAQISARGGFICAAEGLEAQLNTGQGAWQVARITAWSFTRKRMPSFHVIGPAQCIDAQTACGDVAPIIVAHPIHEERTGAVQGIWQLYPTPLPEMLRRPVITGRIRAVSTAPLSAPLTAEACASPEIAAWQRLLDAGAAVEVPPHTTRYILWDLDEYYCGYETVTLAHGAGSRVSLEWAESLYHVDAEGKLLHSNKGNRDEVEGKIFIGFGEQFMPDGGETHCFQSHWWRSGRYLLLTIETADAPLRVEQLGIVETRYPIENASTWRSSDAELTALQPMFVRAIQMCSHETFMDCPYYEQTMYVGDTRLQMLVTGVMSNDDRLIRRGIELFDWSRWRTGFIAERYPSTPPQQSLTFAMLWVAMLHDYARWHDDTDFVRARMRGMRAQFEEFFALLSPESLLIHLPGWNFVDWVPEWDDDLGIPPDGERGASAIVNLLFTQALRQAAELEAMYGEEAFAMRYRDVAAGVGQAIMDRFWCPEQHLLADDSAHTQFSEHALSLALLTEILPEAERAPVLEQLITNPALRRATIYFSFYLFEALYKFDRGDLIVEKLASWKELLHRGLRTTVESPEPTRSDCHAWGAHPLFHYHASLAGIRPLDAGFRRVRIAPSPGPLTQIDSTLPTPHGEMSVALTFDRSQRCTARIILPAAMTGEFCWRGKTYALRSGECNEIDA